MELLGLLVLLASLVTAAWWVATGKPNRGFMVMVALAGIFVGIFLLVQDRVLEITIKGIGTIKAAAEQAVLDAKQVAEIRQRIEAQSATVDLVAKQAADAKRLSEALSTKSELANQKLKNIDDILKKASAALSELQVISEFTTTVILAQNDDRDAFDQLKLWAKDKSYPLSGRAKQAWVKILELHDPGMYSSRFTIPWREGLDPSKLTLDDLRKTYKSTPPLLKPALLEYIWNRQDVSKAERMAFLAEVIRGEKSLKALEYAGRYFAQGANLKLRPLAIEKFLAWWEENKNKVQ